MMEDFDFKTIGGIALALLVVIGLGWMVHDCSNGKDYYEDSRVIDKHYTPPWTEVYTTRDKHGSHLQVRHHSAIHTLYVERRTDYAYACEVNAFQFQLWHIGQPVGLLVHRGQSGIEYSVKIIYPREKSALSSPKAQPY